MLSCRDLSHLADALLDAVSGLWQRLRVRLHLSTCNGCARLKGQMRSTRSLVAAEAKLEDTGDGARIESNLAALHTK